jgi:hypothetical protein
MKTKSITTILSSLAAISLGLTSCTTPAKTPVMAGTTATATATVPATKPYPLSTCIVSGEDLDSMGGAITKV